MTKTKKTTKQKNTTQKTKQISNTNPTKNRGRTQAPANGKLFLPFITRTLSLGYTSGNTNL